MACSACQRVPVREIASHVRHTTSYRAMLWRFVFQLQRASRCHAYQIIAAYHVAARHATACHIAKMTN